jgi:arsenite methyltransferase
MKEEIRGLHEKRPSLENLVETQDLELEVLHPGGLELTKELAELCHIDRASRVLDVASGTGESACYLQENFGSRVLGIDVSSSLIERAKDKAAERRLSVQFLKGDAHNLPFEKGIFHAVISECTTCILDKERAIREMVRVAKPGGYVGIHDICWKANAPKRLMERLAEIEGERPETLDGWNDLFEKAGLIDVKAADKSTLLPSWTKDIKKQLGIIGQLRIFIKIARRWGISGLRDVLESERIFQSSYTGYGLIVGKKPLK